MDEREVLKRMIRGHRAAAELQKELLAADGPRKETAFSDFLSLVSFVDELNGWPANRDKVDERELEEVRHRWSKIQTISRDAHRKRRATRRENAKAPRQRT